MDKLGSKPAFPIDVKYSERSDLFRKNNTGMSKRLYIATQIAGSFILSYKEELSGNNGFPVPEFLVRQSYLIADELLKQENDV
jgi:hypothetical protein